MTQYTASHPPGQGFIDDPHAQNVEARQLGILAPVQWRAEWVGELPPHAAHRDVGELAQPAPVSGSAQPGRHQQHADGGARHHRLPAECPLPVPPCLVSAPHPLTCRSAGCLVLRHRSPG